MGPGLATRGGLRADLLDRAEPATRGGLRADFPLASFSLG